MSLPSRVSYALLPALESVEFSMALIHLLDTASEIGFAYFIRRLYRRLWKQPPKVPRFDRCQVSSFSVYLSSLVSWQAEFAQLHPQRRRGSDDARWSLSPRP